MANAVKELDNLRHHLAIVHEQNRLAKETAEYIASKSAIIAFQQQMIQDALSANKMRVDEDIVDAIKEISDSLNARNEAIGDLVRASDDLQEVIAIVQRALDRDLGNTLAAIREQARHQGVLERLRRQAKETV